MRAVGTVERRHSQRRLLNRVAKIQLATGTLPRDCLITDISAGGVRLHIEGFQVPDEFVLYLSGEGIPKECTYRVVWRLGHEVGARFVGVRPALWRCGTGLTVSATIGQTCQAGRGVRRSTLPALLPMMLPTRIAGEGADDAKRGATQIVISRLGLQ